MKKTYEAPSIEKIAFRYRDQVVVASGTTCKPIYENVDGDGNNLCDANGVHTGYNK